MEVVVVSDPDRLEQSRLGVWLRRYGLAAYWLVYAILTLDWARHPGFVPDPESVPYPWGAVFVTWGVVAVAVGILYAILRPPTFHQSWGRLGGALLFTAGLTLLAAMTFLSDMPGYYYVPHLFSFFTLLGLLLLAGALTLRRLVPRRPRHN
jgi:hypothetical protein